MKQQLFFLPASDPDDYLADHPLTKLDEGKSWGDSHITGIADGSHIFWLN